MTAPAQRLWRELEQPHVMGSAHAFQNCGSDGLCRSRPTQKSLTKERDGTAELLSSTLVARIDVLQPIKPVVFVNHATAFQLTREVDRERQAVAVAEYLERKIVMRPSLVIVAGDLNAHPDAASIRYVTSSRRVSIAP